ncbi:Membrane protein involved in the export of O-antigen and teichoic acid [Ruminococcaceae bacterium YRB3002]|nr:Membrane protein involved in the export of O-antigen and teichoic acid [Ruminococcaceae bacterium YRB3002]
MNREQIVAKNSFIFTVGRIAAQIAGFLLLPLYSDLLAPEDYGTADLINTLVFLLLPFVGFQLDTALFRFTVENRNDQDKQKELLSTVTVINLLQILVYVAVYFAVRPLITLAYKDFLLLNVILIIPVNTLLQFIRGLGHNIMYSSSVFITSATGLIINVILVAGLRWGVTGIIVGSAASQFITLLYLIIAARLWRFLSINRFSKDSAKILLKYSVPLIPNQLAWWVMGISDRLVISGTIGIAANGIYSLANKFSSIYTSVSDSINLSWMESASVHINADDRKEYLSGMISHLFVLFSSACFSFITLIPYAFILINNNYSDSFMQIPILLLAVLCQAVAGIYSSVLIALKKTRGIAITSIIAAIINIVIDIVLVRRFGIYAGSISTLIAFMILAILRVLLVRKILNISPSLKQIIPVTLWGIIVMCCFYLKNPYINALSALVTFSIAIIVNRKIIGLIVTFIRNKMFDSNHNKRRQMIYGKMRHYDGAANIIFNNENVERKNLDKLITYKDESWNYIRDLRKYQEYLMRGKHPDWEDNICISSKYSINGDIITVDAPATNNNWLCFYINEQLPDSYEISYDICLHTEITEVQLAFNYVDLGNRYRFMIKDNRTCLFETVYEGYFLDPYIQVPYKLSLDRNHRICVRVIYNIYEMYVDGERILAVEENGKRSVDGDRACIILWNETDSVGIDCEISNIRIRGI